MKDLTAHRETPVSKIRVSLEIGFRKTEHVVEDLRAVASAIERKDISSMGDHLMFGSRAITVHVELM